MRYLFIMLALAQMSSRRGLTSTTSTGFSPFMHGRWISRICEISRSSLSETCCADLESSQRCSRIPSECFRVLSAFTSISPYLPLSLRVKALCFPLLPDVIYEHALVVAIVPLCNVFRGSDLFVIDGDDGIRIITTKQTLECLLGSLSRADPDVMDAGRVDQLAIAD
jgi:hypothetical protein